MRSSTRNNVTTVTLGPVKDVDAFAEKIDFGEATVNNRTITVKAKKVDVPGAGSDEITKYLFDIKSPGVLTRVGALDKLGEMSVKKDRQEEVAAALVPLLKHDDIRTPRAAAKALGVWGTKDSITPLSDALKANDPFNALRSHGRAGQAQE